MYSNYQSTNGYNYTKQDYDIHRHLIEKCNNPESGGYKSFGACGYTVCDRWLDLHNFLEDLPKIKNSILYFSNRDKYQLAITNGSKEFNLYNCEFVPSNSNSRTNSNYQSNTEYTGVHYTGTGYQVHIYINGKNIFLGTFSNEIAAANIYNAILIAVTNNTYGINNVNFMPISECLKYRAGRTPLILPDNIHIAEIDIYNNSLNKFIGVKPRDNGTYMVRFYYNNQDNNYGTFTNNIAAANAYNWYIEHGDYPGAKINNLAEEMKMQPSEWLKYKTRGKRSSVKNMVKFIDEPKEEQDKRCLERYGMIFN